MHASLLEMYGTILHTAIALPLVLVTLALTHSHPCTHTLSQEADLMPLCLSQWELLGNWRGTH